MEWWRRARKPIRLAAVAVTLIALVVVATGALALFAARPALGAQSTLTILGGMVEVRSTGGTFAAATDGQVVEAGVTIRTGTASHAVLTYVDGTTVTLEPETEVIIERLDVTASGDLIAVVQQTFGRTWHVVQHVGAGGQYDVRTPAATAAVRGTAFAIAVAHDGTMEMTTAEGLVAVGNALATVEVGADQRTAASATEAPQTPIAALVPQAVVRIALESVQNAVAVDASGRSVGVRNGVPVRYAPGSKVELIDGRLVLTIPTNEPGRISTVIQRDLDTQQSVEIETQVTSRGTVVSQTTERRAMDEAGTAKGGVILTTEGVIVLPDREARSIGAPIIGKAPKVTAPVPQATPIPSLRPTDKRTTFEAPRPPLADFNGAFQRFATGGVAPVIPLTSEAPSGAAVSRESTTVFARVQPPAAARGVASARPAASAPASSTAPAQGGFVTLLPIATLPVAAPTPAPTSAPRIATASPLAIRTPAVAPLPTASPIATLGPTATLTPSVTPVPITPALPTPTTTATPAPTAAIVPIVLATPTPTPTPAPTAAATPAPAPVPTLRIGL